MSGRVNQPKSTRETLNSRWNRFCREQTLKIQTTANKFNNSTYIKPEDRGVAGNIFAMPAATARTITIFVGFDMPTMVLDPTTLAEGVGNMIAPLTYRYGRIQPTYIDNVDGQRKYLVTDGETGKAEENKSAAAGDFTEQPLRATLGTFGNFVLQTTEAANEDKLNAIGNTMGWMMMTGGGLKALESASTLSKTYKIISFIGMNTLFGAMDNMHISQNMLADTTMPAALFSDLEKYTPEMKETLDKHILSQLRYELKQAPTEVFSSDYPDQNLETFLKISDKIVSYNGNIENNNILPVIADYLSIVIGTTNNSEAYKTCKSELNDDRSYSGKVDSLIRFATASLPNDLSVKFKKDLQACGNDDNAKLEVIIDIITTLGKNTIDEKQIKIKRMEHYLEHYFASSEGYEKLKKSLNSAENDQKKLEILFPYLGNVVYNFAYQKFMDEFKNVGDDKNKQLDFLTNKLLSIAGEKETKKIKTELANINDYSDKLNYWLTFDGLNVSNLEELKNITANALADQEVGDIYNSLNKINTTNETTQEEKTSKSVQIMYDAMMRVDDNIKNLEFEDLFEYELQQAQAKEACGLSRTYASNWDAKRAALAQLRQMAIEANAFGLNKQNQPRTPEEALQTPHLMLHNQERLMQLNYSFFINNFGDIYARNKLPYMLNKLSSKFKDDKDLPNDPMVKEVCELSGKKFFNACTNNGNMDNFLCEARKIIEHPNSTPENKLWALMLLDKKAKESGAFTETLYGKKLSATDAIYLGYNGTNKELYTFVENKMYELILEVCSSVEAE